MKFNSPQYALRWAYETINRPGDVDSHAQASLILNRCEHALPSLHMDYVRVQFGREADGFDSLCEHLAARFGGGLHSRRGIEQIIRAYCGEKIGLRDIRKTLDCGMLMAASKRNHAYDALDLIHDQSMEILGVALDEAGYLAGQS